MVLAVDAAGFVQDAAGERCGAESHRTEAIELARMRPERFSAEPGKDGETVALVVAERCECRLLQVDLDALGEMEVAGRGSRTVVVDAATDFHQNSFVETHHIDCAHLVLHES